MSEIENRYHNRDLSWLSFNERVLLEAAGEQVPVYEKLKFLAIYSSNLDEFFRVRVAGIRSLIQIDSKKINKALDNSPELVLKNINIEVDRQQKLFGQIYKQTILPELAKQNITIWQGESLNDQQTGFLSHYFKARVLGYLQPKNILQKDGVFLQNRALYFAVSLTNPNQNNTEQALYIVNIPSEDLPRFVKLPADNKTNQFIFLDDVIRLNMEFVFPDLTIEGIWSIKLNRDADLQIEDEFSGDLLKKIQKNLTKRNIGTPSRFLFDETMPKSIQAELATTLDLNAHELVQGGRYHNFYDFFSFPNPLKPKLEFDNWQVLVHPELEREPSILDAIAKKDFILHFPYQSYDYVLRLFNEASIDSTVEEIRVTLYRVASQSAIAQALISAVKNGKKVVVFMELKARFDEQNNIYWASKMEYAGITIIYSLPGLKVHAKVALFIRNVNGKKQRMAFLGTGNFNEKTADIYADHAILTSDKGITSELEALLKYLHKKKKVPTPKELLISQFNLQPKFISLIDREIKHAMANYPGHIIIKLNNLEDQVMIDKLYEASQAGVKVDLIIRGICCLVPDKKNLSENIRIIRIVDRFLEHARVFWFNNKGESEIFMGSADWMKRNLYSRIEVIFPIKNPELANDMKRFLEIQLEDNYKAVVLDELLQNKFQALPERKKIAQRNFYTWLKNKNVRWERAFNDKQEKTP